MTVEEESNYRKTLLDLDFDQEEIDEKVNNKIFSEKWRPVTIGEVKDMDVSKHANLMTGCYENGEERYYAEGIFDLKIIKNDNETYDISWCSGHGDPSASGFSLETLVYEIGEGDEWEYCLYTEK